MKLPEKKLKALLSATKNFEKREMFQNYI